jgi:F-type H+-transporting ATPase subunit a
VFKKLFTVRNLIILVAIIALFAISGLLGLKVNKPQVELAAPVVFHLGPLTITNSLFCAWIVMLLLIVVAWLATRRIPRNLESAPNSSLVPRGLQNVMEMVIEVVHDMVKDIAGPRVTKFFPIVMTIFLFVLVSNWFDVLPFFGTIGVLEHPTEEMAITGNVANGALLTNEPAKSAEEGYVLVPLFRPPSTDLNFTLALAVISVGLSWYFGVRAQGGHFFKQFLNVDAFKNGVGMGVVQNFAGLLEFVGQFTRIISFSFRLFGNIFAGEVLLAVMAFLIPYIASLPFYGLEVFVGFIQAVVFMMLTLVFFVTATMSHGSEEHA